MLLNADLGSDLANSYVTVAEADSYFSSAFKKDSWANADPVDKSALLITASRTLDQFMEWEGSKASETQSMEWPRNGAGFSGIPKRIKDATFELAYYILGNNGLSFMNQTIDSVKVGPISLGFTPSSVDAGIPEFIEKMLQSIGSPILTGGKAPVMAKLVRV